MADTPTPALPKELTRLLDEYRDAIRLHGCSLSHARAEALAGIALEASLVEYVERLAAAERERDEWRGHAIGLGVRGEWERDTARRVLHLRMQVDAGVLHSGGLVVLDATLLDMRNEYRAYLREQQKPMEEAAIALNTALADKARRERRAATTPAPAPEPDR